MSNPDPPTGDRWLTVAEAAAAMGVSPRTIRRRCEAGKLAARRVATPHGGRAWLINPLAAGHPNGQNDRPNGQTWPTDGQPLKDNGEYESVTRPPNEVVNVSNRWPTDDRTATSDRPTGQNDRANGQSVAAPTDSETRLARMEGYAARDLELVIAAAVEKAVSTAVAPLVETIAEQSALVAKLTAEVTNLRATLDQPPPPVASGAPGSAQENAPAIDTTPAIKTPLRPIERKKRPARPLWKLFLGIR